MMHYFIVFALVNDLENGTLLLLKSYATCANYCFWYLVKLSKQSLNFFTRIHNLTKLFPSNCSIYYC
ncbi:hypothetical protein SOVF_015900 [Spinacia oleracea]|nr:hypothetical protein SOVF_015900 [Spinacia oleracea]